MPSLSIEVRGYEGSETRNSQQPEIEMCIRLFLVWSILLRGWRVFMHRLQRAPGVAVPRLMAPEP